MRYWVSIILLIIVLSGCAARHRGEPTKSSASNYSLAAPDMLRIGLAQHRMKVVIEVKQDALLLAMNDRSQICTLTGNVELNLTDSGIAWRSESDSGFNTTGLIVMPLNPASKLIWDEIPYPGEFLIQKRGQGLTLINIVGLEQYLRGVVPWEIGRPGLTGMAALEAQSIAARTYSIANLKNREEIGFDMWADVRDQVYRGHSGLDLLCDKAISNTKGLILRSGGQIVEAYYCSTCGGKTSNINQVWAKESKPYLVSHPDGPAGDYHCSASKYSKWETVFNGGEIDQTLLITLPEYIEWLEASELRKKWAGKYFIPASPGSDPMTPGRLKNISIQSRTASGRVAKLAVVTDAGKYIVCGDRTRWVLAPPSGRFSILKSAWFDVHLSRDAEGRPDQVTLKGRGFGHGIGMCQTGALGMAAKGISYKQILKHYYPGSSIEQAWK
ncbi:MAG: SpoIID/LytB domain-containing protein [bacterium]|nr:SpoIID/LytB domain-containing protein [bacterium]MCP4799264.1 SpoIID/LytB domain-containing protein [bacterium]